MIKTREDINDCDFQLSIFAISDLDECDPFALPIPPVDGLDVEGQSWSRFQTLSKGAEFRLGIDQFETEVEHSTFSIITIAEQLPLLFLRGH